MIDYTLKHGSHDSPQDGLCAMEWVSYLAGEEHSDAPVCVDPPLRRFGIGMNDRLPDDLRQQLRPYLARMIGTAGDGRTRERGFMLADWAIHVAAPAALDAAKRPKDAERLRGLPAVVDKESAAQAAKVARGTVADAAHAHAAAAYAADAADAAHAAAAYAAAAVADAAHAHAAAVGVGDGGVARRAMWEHLLPSALDLLDRMLPTEAVELPELAREQYEALCRA